MKAKAKEVDDEAFEKSSSDGDIDVRDSSPKDKTGGVQVTSSAREIPA